MSINTRKIYNLPTLPDTIQDAAAKEYLRKLQLEVIAMIRDVYNDLDNHDARLSSGNL